MRGDGVGVALAQKRIDQFPVLQRKHLAQRRKPRVGVREEKLLRLRRGLNGHPLSGQIGKGINIAVPAHRDHLSAEHVRLRPAILRFPAVDGEAAPYAVDRAALHQFLFILPVDDQKRRPIPQPPEGLGRQIHVNPRRQAACVLIIKGRIIVAADHDNGSVVVLRPFGRVCAAASADQQRGTRQRGTRQRAEKSGSFFLPHSNTPPVPAPVEASHYVIYFYIC